MLQHPFRAGSLSLPSQFKSNRRYNMKRLNPETGKPFVRGDTRADGFLFWQYHLKRVKRDGYFTEQWFSVSAFNKTLSRNRQKWRDYDAAWRSKNVEQIRENSRKNTSNYRLNNPVKVKAQYAKSRAAKLQRTPKWLTQEHYIQIESIYALAKQLTEETGVLHHVDHIVPLQGKLVSGLHVPWNLRAIPATENLSKSNRPLYF